MFTNSICREFVAVYFERESDEILRNSPVPRHCPLSIKADHFYPRFYDLHTFP